MEARGLYSVSSFPTPCFIPLRQGLFIEPKALAMLTDIEVLGSKCFWALKLRQ